MWWRTARLEANGTPEGVAHRNVAALKQIQTLASTDLAAPAHDLQALAGRRAVIHDSNNI
jgi:hypothetical protein